jgi:hypothetical protein
MTSLALPVKYGDLISINKGKFISLLHIHSAPLLMCKSSSSCSAVPMNSSRSILAVVLVVLYLCLVMHHA